MSLLCLDGYGEIGMISMILAIIFGLILWLCAMGVFLGCIAGIAYLFSFLINSLIKPGIQGWHDRKEAARFEDEQQMLRAVKNKQYKPKPKPASKEPREEKSVSPLLIYKAVEKADEYINDAEISSSLKKCSNLLKQFERLKTEEDNSKMNKMYTLYLPSLLKVLKQYADLKPFGENETVAGMKTKIISLTGVINKALQENIAEIKEKNERIMNADMKALEALLRNDMISSTPPAGDEQQDSNAA